jgi:hypothetical protein
LNANITHSMSDNEFLKLVLPVVAKVKCAHTLFYPSREILGRGARFPIDLKFINGRAYVVDDSLSQDKIPLGSELLSINGKSLQDVIDLIFPGLEAQGGNRGWKYVTLENDFQNYYYYLIEHADSFAVEYIDYNTKQRASATIRASANEILKAHWKNWYPKKDGAPLKIEFVNDPEVAVITIQSMSKRRCDMYGQDFDKLLAQYFEEIAKRETKNLIIDIRGNEGGNNPEQVYAYIAREGDKSIDGSAKSIVPTSPIFRGKVILLMNERSISSLEVFAGTFINNNRGLTIGHSTPGSFNGLCGGNKRKIILSNSKFEIQIPLHASTWTFTRAFDLKVGEGFSPDIKIEENIDDILAGKDQAMELALRKLKNGD